MEILVCVKRVPTVGGAITLTPDGQAVDTRMSGFTISPHEECAVEEAVRLVSAHGGSVTVVTLGPVEAEEQLRACLALGASRAVLLEAAGPADGSAAVSRPPELGPIATASALASVALAGSAEGAPYDLVLLGNEASDTGDYQVGIRLAHLLGRPVATGIKSLTASPGATSIEARREYRGVAEAFRLPLPAVVTVKEGINLPRYPSLPGRLRAKRAQVERISVGFTPEGLRMRMLRVPVSAKHSATVLGQGVSAVPELVRVLGELGVLA
jgi:electron transfer flavoprotein beta subunit